MVVAWTEFMLKLITTFTSLCLFFSLFSGGFLSYTSVSARKALFKINLFLEDACLFSVFLHGRSFLYLSFIGDRRRYIVHIKIRISQLTQIFRKSMFTTLIHFSPSTIRNTVIVSQLWLSNIFLYFHSPLWSIFGPAWPTGLKGWYPFDFALYNIFVCRLFQTRNKRKWSRGTLLS